MTGRNPGPQRHVVVHGHFYQPPRENPWLGIVERQVSAAPAHDWNERVFDECYRPNAFSRLLDPRGMIRGVHNNYATMSFNFGPTLMRWLEEKHPEVVQRIIDGDAASRERLRGHGNAIAQVYNHMIMPLASARDQLTQIRWAKSFFRSHFGRETEGIWLAESAINMTTVRCLIEEGIRFTILSPTQAEEFRPIDGSHDWTNLGHHAIDTRRPYRIFHQTPEGQRTGGFLDVFFFDQELSRSVSFGATLTNADALAHILDSRFDPHHAASQAVVIATDGETFGHHKPFGDMCLAYLFSSSPDKYNFNPVNFGYLLDVLPRAHEVRLRGAFGEGTAWSCAHGVGRWTRDCGCSTGGKAGWSQAWRAPLRAGLTALQQTVDTAFEHALAPVFGDPWRLRDGYIEIMDRPSTENIKALCWRLYPGISLTHNQILSISALLEAQKNMLCAFTSCGWFFADISGIETVQNLMYAARAIQLGISREQQAAVTGDLLRVLDTARSNLPGATGKSLYESQVLPLTRHLEIVAFTLAAQRIVCGKAEPLHVYFGYTAESTSLGRRKNGTTQVEVLRTTIQGPVLAENEEFLVLFSHQEGTAITGCSIPSSSATTAEFDMMDPASWHRHPHALSMDLSRIFEESRLDLASYFLRRIFERTMQQYSSWLTENEPILDSLSLLYGSLPATLAGPITFVLNAEWNRNIAVLAKGESDSEAYTRLLEIDRKAKRYNVKLDLTEATAVIEEHLLSELGDFSRTIDDALCDRMTYLLNIVDRFAIPVRKHIMEDLFYSMLYAGIADVYRRFMMTPEPDHDQKALLLRVLSFARRMNFSTEQFPMK